MMRKPPTFVYVIEARNGLIKIGSAQIPEDRLRSVHTHSAEPCRMIAKIVGDMAQEKELHRLFAPQRSHFEWFRVEGPVVQFVDMVRGRGLTEIEPFEFMTREQRKARELISRRAGWARRKVERRAQIAADRAAAQHRASA